MSEKQMTSDRLKTGLGIAVEFIRRQRAKMRTAYPGAAARDDGEEIMQHAIDAVLIAGEAVPTLATENARLREALANLKMVQQLSPLGEKIVADALAGHPTPDPREARIAELEGACKKALTCASMSPDVHELIRDVLNGRIRSSPAPHPDAVNVLREAAQGVRKRIRSASKFTHDSTQWDQVGELVPEAKFRTIDDWILSEIESALAATEGVGNDTEFLRAELDRVKAEREVFRRQAEAKK